MSGLYTILGDANMIQLIAQVTIQHLTQRDGSYKEVTIPLTPVKEVDETKVLTNITFKLYSIFIFCRTHFSVQLLHNLNLKYCHYYHYYNFVIFQSPVLSPSPPRELLTVSGSNEEVSAEMILRRLSNAYSASETPSVLVSHCHVT